MADFKDVLGIITLSLFLAWVIRDWIRKVKQKKRKLKQW